MEAAPEILAKRGFWGLLYKKSGYKALRYGTIFWYLQKYFLFHPKKYIFCIAGYRLFFRFLWEHRQYNRNDINFRSKNNRLLYLDCLRFLKQKTDRPIVFQANVWLRELGESLFTRIFKPIGRISFSQF